LTIQEVAVALIRDQGRWFAQRRDPAARRCPGLWEFPGGKLEPLESPRQALLRELEEELRRAPARAEALPWLRHDYPDLAVVLHPFLCRGPRPLRTALAWGWFDAEQLGRLAMPAANRLLLAKIGALR